MFPNALMGSLADSPINVIGEGDAILGGLEGDDADGGLTALQLLHCLPQQRLTARPRDIHTAQVHQVTCWGRSIT